MVWLLRLPAPQIPSVKTRYNLKLAGGGKPSGPLSFMRVYDQIAAVVKSGELPAGPAAIAVHTGTYETLGATHEAMQHWLEANPAQQQNGGPWELYISDPAEVMDPAKWMTEVIYPLKPNTEIS